MYNGGNFSVPVIKTENIAPYLKHYNRVIEPTNMQAICFS